MDTVETRRDLVAAIRAIELNVDGLNTKGFRQRPETQLALDRIKEICRKAIGSRA